MIKKIVKLVAIGISWGCTISCIVSMIGAECIGTDWFTNAPNSYTAQIIASMLVGIAWSVPSLVYDNERLSRAQQILIHGGIGLGVYFPIAFYMQWIPRGNIVMVLVSMAVMILGTLLIWCGFYLYYRGETKAINRQLKSKE